MRAHRLNTTRAIHGSSLFLSLSPSSPCAGMHLHSFSPSRFLPPTLQTAPRSFLSRSRTRYPPPSSSSSFSVAFHLRSRIIRYPPPSSLPRSTVSCTFFFFFFLSFGFTHELFHRVGSSWSKRRRRRRIRSRLCIIGGYDNR